jgi:hypothetical protein
VHRNRRMVLIDRIIPFLAAFVGLVALAGSVVVQMDVTRQNTAIRAELAAARTAMELMAQRNEGLASELQAADIPVDDGTAEALLALQDRMIRLEDSVKAAPLAAPAAMAPDGDTVAAKPIDPNLPTTDCIPQGTRFMATTTDDFPICQSKVVIRAAAVSDDTVTLSDGTSIVETGFSALPGTTCTAMVFSADIEGFAEMRVTCQ